MGGLLQSIFGQDYNGFYDLETVHPETGENLFVGTYANGAGADVIAQSDLPEQMTGEPMWEDFMIEANASLIADASDAAFLLADSAAQVSGQLSEQLTNLMNGGKINMFDPDYLDLQDIEHAVTLMQDLMEDKSVQVGVAPNGFDFAERAAELAEMETRLQEHITGAQYSALMGVNEDLTNAGFSPEQIESLTTNPIDPAANTNPALIREAAPEQQIP